MDIVPRALYNIPQRAGLRKVAQAGAGALAYYEPWGDVVFFYGDYSENPRLFELGQAVSGGELVSAMSGTITIEAVE